jgi:hypothetical protein
MFAFFLFSSRLNPVLMETRKLSIPQLHDGSHFYGGSWDLTSDISAVLSLMCIVAGSGVCL